MRTVVVFLTAALTGLSATGMAQTPAGQPSDPYAAFFRSQNAAGIAGGVATHAAGSVGAHLADSKTVNRAKPSRSASAATADSQPSADTEAFWRGFQGHPSNLGRLGGPGDVQSAFAHPLILPSRPILADRPALPSFEIDSQAWKALRNEQGWAETLGAQGGEFSALVKSAPEDLELLRDGAHFVKGAGVAIALYFVYQAYEESRKPAAPKAAATQSPARASK